MWTNRCLILVITYLVVFGRNHIKCVYILHHIILDSNTERLNNIFLETIQQEIKDTDERIRVYSEKQFALLHIFKTKAEHDLKTLSKLVNNSCL